MDDQNKDPEVVDAEVVEETPQEPQVVGDAAILLNLEEMIKNYIQSLDKLREEKKKMQEMFEDSFANNPTYRENSDKAKEALKVKATTRQQIASQPSVIALAQKLKGLGSDIKERQVALSDYLLEYQRLSGANEIEDNEGQIREIINSAKLIKRSSKK
ncbi:MAG: hypothetical protein HZC02_04225 [Candidatus Levybacteria bacterium]|nr:hypothetical protein [Candidatus Levybacteria bacterium]